MGLFQKFFGSKESIIGQDSLLVDMHNHLIFDVDDGSKMLEESIDMIRGMVALGRKKIIMTPHIMSDFYKNGPETINPKLS
jgi:protein-tyrosine phosphatase